jgi:DnaJ-class molecular chaperone
VTASLAGCPYYLTRGLPDAQRGLCSSGCRDEPACITSEPEGGWPVAKPADLHWCPTCKGRGSTALGSWSYARAQYDSVACSACEGTGVLPVRSLG